MLMSLLLAETEQDVSRVLPAILPANRQGVIRQKPTDG
jgi:hypothetical protein